MIISRRHNPATLLDHVGRGYPRPQLVRDNWTSLNGSWEFALDADAVWRVPGDVEWKQEIIVPFAPESPASGVGNTGFFRSCWYRRRFPLPDIPPGYRLHLHFGAVDFETVVWVNGQIVGRHSGGYTPFWFDITNCISGEHSIELIVRASDDPDDLAKPRGKQDWQLQPHSIWYPRATGIWQTVWYELVPQDYIATARWTPNLERWEIGLDADFAGPRRDGLRIRVRLYTRDVVIADDTYAVFAREVHRRIALSDPGIDDYRNELLWSPESPTLIQAELELLNEVGDVLDRASSYTALRSISAQRDRIVLNNRPYPLRLVLDQGYWPDTGQTAPDDQALRLDVELAKRMGFNGVRKHQKLEDPRYLFWADVLGLLVWGEMPSAYRFTAESVARVTHEWIAAVHRDYSHPCVVAWVPINESWGVPNLPDNPAERHYVQALYHLTRTLDPTRPVIGNDGWESVATDIVGIHDYDDDPERLARRYHAADELPRLFRRERPGGRLLVLESERHSDLPIVLSEFGGIALSVEQGTWGYARARSASEFAARYERLMRAVHSVGLLSGFCYTQFTDTYQEANGLLYANRQPKIPFERIAAATRGVFRAPEDEHSPSPLRRGEGPDHAQALTEKT